MDVDTKELLRGAYQCILGQERALLEVQIVTCALVKTIQELGPQAEKTYEKHRAAESAGPLRKTGELDLARLAELVRRLS